MVTGKFTINRNSFGDRWQLKQYVVFTGHINLCPDGSETHLDGSGTFVRGSGRSWKCSRSVRNVLKRSRYVLEGPGSF